MEDEIKKKRETIKIEGDRNLYNYTFEVPQGEEEETKNTNPPLSEKTE